MNRGMPGAPALLLACVLPPFAQSFAQSADLTDLPPAMRLLAQVTQRYAEAQNYYIKAIERDAWSGEFEGEWTKKVLIASESRRRFRFEVQTVGGSAVAMADGYTVRLRHTGERAYASRPESDQERNNPSRALDQDEQIRQAKRLRASLASLAKNVTEASFLPNQSFPRGDGLVRSRVILIREGKRGIMGLDAWGEKTVWIDEEEGKIVKVVERRIAPADAAGGAKDIEVTTTFETSFDADQPDCLFDPEAPGEPSNRAASPRRNVINLQSVLGKKLSDLRFADGKTITLTSLSGKPLLIDFWATWCGPCVASLPELAEIYDETRGKGLIFLGVDEDKDVAKGSAFLERRGYTWPNFTDPDGEVHKQLGYEGIPHVILVDSGGTIVFDGTGEDARELRSSIAKLGPEFRSVDPESGPCVMPK